MPRVFSVKGRVAWADGAPAAGVYIALVDEDPECDDLLGVGVSNGDGVFALSFTREAFNQEVGEDEERPDLYAIFSIEHEGARVPVLRRDFAGLSFEADEDLGTTKLPEQRAGFPVAAIGLRAAPGLTKLVRRVSIDDHIVEQAAREVAPLVEQLTGWTNLLDGVRFVIVDSFVDIEHARARRQLGTTQLDDEDAARVDRAAESCEVGTFARWQPEERTIYVNRPMMEAQNYDALRVTLGHELVHAGQSKAHAEVDAEILRIQSVMPAHRRAGTEPPAEERDAAVRFLSNIEGYATYVEEELLRVFTHGTSIWGARLQARFRDVERRQEKPWAPTPEELEKARKTSWKEILEAGAGSKTSQYAAGRAAYLARAKDAGGGTVRFDPALRPELHYQPRQVALVRAAAELGNPVTQYELAMLLMEGKGGVERDLVEAEKWFRRSAEGGLGIAVHSLGLLLPKDHPERIGFLRKSAEQGYALAQVALGQALYERNAQGEGAEAFQWFEKAAAQSNPYGMRALANLYEKGIGVPRDVVKARVWMKRAEALERTTSR